ncbi:MAG TPA: 16S rRNA (cytosine(1402)-N(4))-methyltransferase, partial [Nitrospirota bacterium]|nr:16S rRNA (cytosine(1402)-N(4))-methyltransferase [Nitrospirota bacterium]
MKQHVPVLLEEVLKELRCDRPGLYIDCTVGAGGHTSEILASSPDNRVIGIDWDNKAIETARENLKGFGDRVTFIREDYSSIGSILDDMNISEADGFLFDLGLSSMQIDSPERGFSFRQDSPLDMRMDMRKETTAAELVNNLDAG